MRRTVLIAAVCLAGCNQPARKTAPAPAPAQAVVRDGSLGLNGDRRSSARPVAALNGVPSINCASTGTVTTAPLKFTINCVDTTGTLPATGATGPTGPTGGGATGATGPTLPPPPPPDTAVTGVTYDVSKLGATANGSTDAAPAIQAALDKCHTGDKLYIPAGTYAMRQVNIKPQSSGCLISGARSATKLIGLDPNGVMLYFVVVNNVIASDIKIENLDFDLSKGTGVAIKGDWEAYELEIRYNTFRNGGAPAAIFLTDGSRLGRYWSSIHHNKFINVNAGVYGYGKYQGMHIDRNWFETFTQGISGGGCKDKVASGTTIDNNVFLLGKRMAIELCGGLWDDVSVSYNYIANWRPSDNPAGESYPVCSGSYPYMCDSMAISLAIGGRNVRAIGNMIYRQPGTSWGIEYTVLPDSVMSDNLIKNAGVAMVDEACANIGAGDNCTQTRQKITNNQACGGNVGANQRFFGYWPTSNKYYDNCASFPAEKPVPAQPF